MAYEGYACLRIERDRGVAFVTIDHPPINLFDLPLIQEMNRVGVELEADEQVRVAVFRSADPEFFIAHADVNLIQMLPAEAIALAKASVNAAELPTLEGLTEEAHYFNLSVATAAARQRMAAFMAAGGQTREVEMNLGKALG